MSQRDLAKNLFLSQQTIWKYEAGKASPAPEMIGRIASVLNVSVAWLLEVDESVSGPELQRIKKYRTLDEHGKRAVDAILDIEASRYAVKPTKVVPLFGNSFAAGAGEPDLGNAWSSYETENMRADFAIRIHGDSMEPYLPDESIQLGTRRKPADGEVAALLIDGEFLVKQVAIDSIGNMYLFALNRDRKDTDRILWAKDDHYVSCFGTVIMRRVGLPND